MSIPRVLSIQSHVVSGYVGNKSAVFPLQLLGFDVDFINSVQFSNHTGYKLFKGQVLNEKELDELYQGLALNDIDRYSHLLTGYIGSQSFLNKVSYVLKQLRDKNPDLIYVCDPVMGDNGKLYVPKELISSYKEIIVPLATIITPNLFEAELLTDMKIKNEADVWVAVDKFHSKGCQTVVVSSSEFESKPGLLTVFASTVKGEVKQRYSMEIEKLPRQFTGTGDLFTALFLSWMYKTNDLKLTLENTISTLYAVLKRTMENVNGQSAGEEKINPRNLELKLIQSKRDIESPIIVYKAKSVD